MILSFQDFRLWDPFQTAIKWLYNGGGPKLYLLTGTILQVAFVKIVKKGPYLFRPAGSGLFKRG